MLNTVKLISVYFTLSYNNSIFVSLIKESINNRIENIFQFRRSATDTELQLKEFKEKPVHTGLYLVRIEERPDGVPLSFFIRDLLCS